VNSPGPISLQLFSVRREAERLDPPKIVHLDLGSISCRRARRLAAVEWTLDKAVSDLVV